MQTSERRSWKVRLVFRKGVSGTVELPADCSAREVWHLIRSVYPTCAVYVLQKGARGRKSVRAVA